MVYGQNDELIETVEDIVADEAFEIVLVVKKPLPLPSAIDSFSRRHTVENTNNEESS